MNRLEKAIIDALEHFNETGEILKRDIISAAREDGLENGYVYIKGPNRGLVCVGPMYDHDVEHTRDEEIHRITTKRSLYHTSPQVPF